MNSKKTDDPSIRLLRRLLRTGGGQKILRYACYAGYSGQAVDERTQSAAHLEKRIRRATVNPPSGIRQDLLPGPAAEPAEASSS